MRVPQLSMRFRAGRRLAWRCAGWGTSEYIVVLLGTMAVWRGAQLVLQLIREHHREFSWALMVPF